MDPGGLVLGVDPGSIKAGYALVDADGAVRLAGIEPVGDLLGRLADLAGQYPVRAIALGRGTQAGHLGRKLAALGIAVHLIDEYETSRRARELYFAENPPRGWRRLVPVGLQLPPRAIDDYAAILIARRFLAREALERRPN